ncbi:MFS transporter [Sorangium sp. So ce291]|uniref:MFS transporter n=1 Tax=Sorangium sp. So ce291 TaxID=3133294 RepID=UPI003F5DB706
MKAFWILYAGRLLSVLGSALTAFALGVWVYQESASVTQYALLMMFSRIPSLLLAPFAGSLVDGVDRRRILVGCAIGELVTSAALVLLQRTGELRVHHVYVLSIVSSCLSTFDWLAFSAVTSQMVPREHLGRAGGAAQMGNGVAQLAAPMVSALLLERAGLGGVLLVDCASFVVGLLLLLPVPIPALPAASRADDASPWGRLTRGWTYLRTRRGLCWLLGYFAAINLLVGMVNALAAPMLMELASVRAVSVVVTLGGLGLLVGSVVMLAWGGPRRRVHGILGFIALGGVAVAVASTSRALPVVAAGAFVFYLCQPFYGGSSQALWQTQIPAALQGRVFAVRQMVAISTLPVAAAIAGPLAEHVFEPLMRADGALAPLVGQVVGTGRGRGIALLVALAGAAMFVLSLMASRVPTLARLEDEPPDDEPLSPAA